MSSLNNEFIKLGKELEALAGDAINPVQRYAAVVTISTQLNQMMYDLKRERAEYNRARNTVSRQVHSPVAYHSPQPVQPVRVDMNDSTPVPVGPSVEISGISELI
jgi:hypothetical protein